MNANTETSGASALDLMKMVLAAALLIGGIVAYYLFGEASIALRAAGVVLGVALGIAVFATTASGRELWSFIQSSRIELRKVIWPTRPETIQTTIAVIVFALIMALFFWVLDKGLLWATRLLTGQGS
jgi:preprotein translocase subunit SecE